MRVKKYETSGSYAINIFQGSLGDIKGITPLLPAPAEPGIFIKKPGLAFRKHILAGKKHLLYLQVFLRGSNAIINNYFGAWRSPVAYLVWDQGAAGSNPAAPTAPAEAPIGA